MQLYQKQSPEPEKSFQRLLLPLKPYQNEYNYKDSYDCKGNQKYLLWLFSLMLPQGFYEHILNYGQYRKQEPAFLSFLLKKRVFDFVGKAR